MINVRKIKTSDLHGLPQDVWLRASGRESAYSSDRLERLYGRYEFNIALYGKLNGYAADEELLCGLIFKNYNAAFRPVFKV